MTPQETLISRIYGYQVPNFSEIGQGIFVRSECVGISAVSFVQTEGRKLVSACLSIPGTAFCYFGRRRTNVRRLHRMLSYFIFLMPLPKKKKTGRVVVLNCRRHCDRREIRMLKVKCSALPLSCF